MRKAFVATTTGLLFINTRTISKRLLSVALFNHMSLVQINYEFDTLLSRTRCSYSGLLLTEIVNSDFGTLRKEIMTSEMDLK